VILIDTSVLSRVFRRRQPGPVERRLHVVFERLMLSEAPLGLPGIVLQEALSGLASQREFDDLAARFLGAFSVISATTADHVAAARLRNVCMRRGVNASGVDCLIAATAIGGGHELLTLDADFGRIAKHSALRLYELDGVA
jgi:predicted nucleic acid-binding protein